MSLIKRTKSIVSQIQAYLPSGVNGLFSSGRVTVSSVGSLAVNAPILSADEVVQLADELAMLTQKISVNAKPSQALKQGEQTSQFMGSGLEYEESRPYELGDEIRRINWRLMAKTGKAYTKRFQEERQESWLILVDHRQSMRFGSRVRLKATQASRVAGYFAWLAQKVSVPVVGARLAQSLVLTPCYEGRGSYAHLMDAFSLACPPLDSRAVEREPHLNDVLLSLRQQVQPGARIIIVSDFHDANTTTTEILTALQSSASVKAVMIQDQVEFTLPAVSGLRLQSMGAQNNGSQNQGHPKIIQIDNDTQRANYQAWSKQYHQSVQDIIEHSGVKLITLLADAPLHTLYLDNSAMAASGRAGDGE